MSPQPPPPPSPSRPRPWWMTPQVIVAVVLSALTAFVFIASRDTEEWIKEFGHINPFFLLSLLYHAHDSCGPHSALGRIFEWFLALLTLNEYCSHGIFVVLAKVIWQASSQGVAAVVLFYSSIVAAWIGLMRIEPKLKDEDKGLAHPIMLIPLAALIYLVFGGILVGISHVLGAPVAWMCWKCGGIVAVIAWPLHAYHVYKSGREALVEVKRAKAPTDHYPS